MNGTFDEPIKDYEITVKVRNNYLLRAIAAQGYKSLAEFCRHCNVSYPALSQFVNLSRVPLVVSCGKEKWSESVIEIADALQTVPENLFPPQHIRKCLASHRSTVEANAADLEFMLLQSESTRSEKRMESKDLTKTLGDIIDTLPTKEQLVIKSRYLDDQTFEEAGQTYGVSRERIRQLEARALRNMKRGLNGDRLQQFRTNPDCTDNTPGELRVKRRVKEWNQHLQEERESA